MHQHPWSKSFPVSKLRPKYLWLENFPTQERCSRLRLERTTLPAQLSMRQLTCPQLETVAAHSPQARQIPRRPQWEMALDFVEAPTRR